MLASGVTVTSARKSLAGPVRGTRPPLLWSVIVICTGVGVGEVTGVTRKFVGFGNG